MNIKNLMAIAIVSLIAISSMNFVSAGDGYTPPKPGQLYFDLISNYRITYSITFYDYNHKELPSQYNHYPGDSRACDFSVDYGPAKDAGAKYVEIWADPYTSHYDGRCLYNSTLTDVYLNFWGWVACGGDPRCAVSWIDVNTGQEKHNMVHFP
ncbi:MAG: hypothetical protein LBR15_01445 [Methanobrevibacter sp.]|jgi:hypothetical protein|nr:hypothetical protein [Candidatus Methanovirga australis]